MMRAAEFWRPVCVAVLVIGAVLMLDTGAALGAIAALERDAGVSGFDSTNKTAFADCPFGKRMVGTGADFGNGGGQVVLDDMFPNAALDEATVSGVEDESGYGSTWSVAATALCATPVPGLQRVSASSASNSANKGVTVSCPTGKRLLGTGADITGGGGQVSPDVIVPNAALTGVSVHGVEDVTGFAGSWSVTAYAICANPIAGVQLVTARSATNTTNGKSATATCPAGKQVTGVGGDIRGANGRVVMDDLIPFPDPATSVQVLGLKDDSMLAVPAWSASAYAICAPASELVVGTSVSNSADKSVDANCPTGKRYTGAGYDFVGGGGQVRMEFLTPFDSFGFYGVTAFGNEDKNGTAANWTVRADAICAPPLPGIEVVQAQSVADTQNKSASAVCPAGKKVVGAAGGVIGAVNEVAVDRFVPSSNLQFVSLSGAEDEGGTAFNWVVQVYAICALPPPGLDLTTATSDLGSDPASAIASCPSGKNLLGGGGSVENPQFTNEGQAVLDDMRPNALLTRVTATALEDETGADFDFGVTAYAICANP